MGLQQRTFSPIRSAPRARKPRAWARAKAGLQQEEETHPAPWPSKGPSSGKRSAPEGMARPAASGRSAMRRGRSGSASAGRRAKAAPTGAMPPLRGRVSEAGEAEVSQGGASVKFGAGDVALLLAEDVGGLQAVGGDAAGGGLFFGGAGGAGGGRGGGGASEEGVPQGRGVFGGGIHLVGAFAGETHAVDAGGRAVVAETEAAHVRQGLVGERGLRESGLEGGLEEGAALRASDRYRGPAVGDIGEVEGEAGPRGLGEALKVGEGRGGVGGRGGEEVFAGGEADDGAVVRGHPVVAESHPVAGAARLEGVDRGGEGALKEDGGIRALDENLAEGGDIHHARTGADGGGFAGGGGGEGVVRAGAIPERAEPRPCGGPFCPGGGVGGMQGRAADGAEAGAALGPRDGSDGGGDGGGGALLWGREGAREGARAWA